MRKAKLNQFNVFLWILYASLIVSTVLVGYSTYLDYFNCLEQIQGMEKGSFTIESVNVVISNFWSQKLILGALFKSTVILTAIVIIVSAFRLSFRRGSLYIIILCLLSVAGASIFLDQKYVPTKLFDSTEDANGIPINYYGMRQGEFVGFKINPLFVANIGLSAHESGDIEKAGFAKEKLNDFIVKNDAGYKVKYDFDIPEYDLIKPWYSGLCNSRVALLYFKLNPKDPEVKSLIRPFDFSTKEGGLQIPLEKEASWYPEYPKSKGESPMVLNGMISVLLVLDELWRETKDPYYKDLFEKGVNGLKIMLPKYDRASRSFHDQRGKIASDGYHKMHVAQLRLMYEATGDAIFLKYHHKWSKQ